MARYKMTVVFDVNEQIEMKYVRRGDIDSDMVTLAYEPVKRSESNAITTSDQPHINKLYEDVLGLKPN